MAVVDTGVGGLGYTTITHRLVGLDRVARLIVCLSTCDPLVRVRAKIIENAYLGRLADHVGYDFHVYTLAKLSFLRATVAVPYGIAALSIRT